MEQSFQYFVGIDWGTQTHRVAVLDRTGRAVEQYDAEHSGEGLVSLIHQLKQRTACEPSEVAIGIEVAWGALVETLVESGFTLFSNWSRHHVEDFRSLWRDGTAGDRGDRSGWPRAQHHQQAGGVERQAPDGHRRGQQGEPHGSDNGSAAEQLDADTAKAWQEKADVNPSQPSLSGISVTPSEPGGGDDSHAMFREEGVLDITNATVTEMLTNALNLPLSRLHVADAVPKERYNLHVNLPGADPKQLASGIELAIAAALHVRITQAATEQSAYVLASTSDTHPHMQASPYPGMAAYSHKKELLQCINASPQQIAAALEAALETPVVDETGIAGKFMDNVTLKPKDLASANAAVAGFGLVLRREKRPVETLTVSPAGNL